MHGSLHLLWGPNGHLCRRLQKRMTSRRRSPSRRSPSCRVASESEKVRELVHATGETKTDSSNHEDELLHATGETAAISCEVSSVIPCSKLECSKLDDMDLDACGTWISSKGKCRIFSTLDRLYYEELLDGGQLLHGTLVRCDEEPLWQASVSIGSEERLEAEELVGDIEIALLPGLPKRLQTRIRVVNEDTEWQEPVLFSPALTCSAAKKCGSVRQTRRRRGKGTGTARSDA